MEEIRILVSYEQKIKLLKEAERLRLPLQNYIKLILKRDHSQISTSV